MDNPEEELAGCFTELVGMTVDGLTEDEEDGTVKIDFVDNKGEREPLIMTIVDSEQVIIEEARNNKQVKKC